MMTFVLTVAILLVAFSFLRLRFRMELSEGQKRFFFGLGRSGLEVDLQHRERLLKLMGKTVARSPIGITPARAEQRIEPQPPRQRRSRRSDWREILENLPRIARAGLTFVRGLWASTRIEQCEGALQGGFSSPDLTGQLYGYYQAAAAAIPYGHRFQFVPSWYESPFTGQVRLSVAMPLYALSYRLCVLIIQLPKRALWRLMFHRQKGTQNG